MTYRMRLYLNRMHRFDSNVCVAVNHTSQYRVIRDVFRLVSRCGDGLFWYGLMFAIIVFKGHDGMLPVLHMAVAGLVGTLLYKWLKGKTLRPRPYAVRQISARKIWRLIAAGELPHYRIGRCVRFAMDDVQEWMRQRRSER